MTLVDIPVLKYLARRLQLRLSRVCVHHRGGFVSRRSIALVGGGGEIPYYRCGKHSHRVVDKILAGIDWAVMSSQ